MAEWNDDLCPVTGGEWLREGSPEHATRTARQYAEDARVSAQASRASAEAAQRSAADIAASIRDVRAQVQGNSEAVAEESARARAEEAALRTELERTAAQASCDHKRLANMLAAQRGELWLECADAGAACVKTVGDAAVTGGAAVLPFAALKSVGGRTVVWNQMVQLIPGPAESAGVQWLFSAEGTLTANGTATALSAVNTDYASTSGHVYLLRGCPAGGGDSTYSMTVSEGFRDYGSGVVFQSSYTGTRFIIARVIKNHSAVDVVFRPQLFDLTLMFGAGREPATPEEFSAMFPDPFYPYSSSELRSMAACEVRSLDGQGALLGSVRLPESLNALTGWGWSAGTAANAVDMEARVYRQAVGRRAYTAGDEADAALVTDGLVTHYPLDAAIEAELTPEQAAQLSPDFFLEVREGGTVEAFGQSGDAEVRVPVFSEIVYLCEITEESA
ncbi:hypothetical protein [Mailhella sp.]|uniref:hypothetical protein n=1 Tax=Mailhella sp. TaxID=1981029 RepID=UPI004064B2CD